MTPNLALAPIGNCSISALIDRNGRYGNQWGQNGWSDRDRDGRDDRYEDDRGRDHD